VAALWASPSFAGDFTLTGVQGGVMGGVYTSPYIANIADFGQGVLVICDDFLTDSFVGDTFTAVATNVASLTGESTPSTDVKFDHLNAAQQQQDYATAAFLAQEIIAQGLANTPSNDYALGILSFALWDVFNPTLLTSNCNLYGCLTTQERTDAQAALNNAITNAGSTSNYANVSVYTPSPDQNRSQEFLVVKTPEPGTLLLLGLGFAGIMLFGSRRRRAASAVAF
jgi:hypothetical protein